MTQQPEALRIAEELMGAANSMPADERGWFDDEKGNHVPHNVFTDAAAELRRLHEENQKFTHRQEWWQEQHDVTVAVLQKAQERITALEAALRQAVQTLEEIHPGNMTPMAEEAWNKAITAAKQALEGEK